MCIRDSTSMMLKHHCLPNKTHLRAELARTTFSEHHYGAEIQLPAEQNGLKGQRSLAPPLVDFILDVIFGASRSKVKGSEAN